MLAGVAEWQTRTFKGRVGDRVGSSPTTSTKKTFGSFFCWWDFVLCTTNALRLEPTLVWLAPVSPCPSAESSRHLTARPTTSTKKKIEGNTSLLFVKELSYFPC